MAAMAAWADWAIHGPLGQLKEVEEEPSMMSCITSGGGDAVAAGGGWVGGGRHCAEACRESSSIRRVTASGEEANGRPDC